MGDLEVLVVRFILYQVNVHTSHCFRGTNFFRHWSKYDKLQNKFDMEFPSMHFKTSLNRGFGEGSVDQYCSFRKITVLM